MNTLKDKQYILKELKNICDRNYMIIIDYNHKRLSIAVAKKPNDNLIATLKFIASVPVCYDIWPKEKIDHYFNSEIHQIKEEETQYQPKEAESLNVSSPAVDFVEDLLKTAVHKRSSDIHLEPTKQGLKIRLRVDGKLYFIPSPPYEINNEIIARIKILAKMNIAEKRRPQDGQMSWHFDGKNYSIRLSSIPTLHGEKLVLRILNTQLKYSLEHIGMCSSLLSSLQDYLNQPQGLILVTGPTGSGKTVTLYSALEYLNKSSRNISTIEDPIEIPLQGVNQTQVNEKYDLSFAFILRALLRQDPDIIMIGEIRDEETAKIATRAAQTGHLVLSTLHTNCTFSAIERMNQLGVSHIELKSCLKMVIAQRLVRKLCPYCKGITAQPVKLNDDLIINQWSSKGCELCFSGFMGRTAIYEYIDQPKIGKLFSGQPSSIEGFDNLFKAGLTLVESGETTLQEIYSVIGHGKL
ncbi:Flp pilus assembly complex ATPase component TadA [Providencia rettgeri]|uniref:GspE family protein n=2 Tax=Providencia rettgeri TaxID=587 RepID=A0AAE3BWU3_PRORE|nr:MULTISPECIES: ATPase, T2SS/T4P/T4SS family [Providencia]MBC8653071.1 Flp pilus assembly complex ATPase component TadA [Providencia vermicola]HCI98039.1 GspE family protein [Providencia sp.]EIU7556428.1 Flp pilus assembly complex ATPase component TadA [Providencia rettgeri]EJD6080815.1 Flp pilus assembly complex ATPase component TadA [Providencia rettgeri]EJD6371293.1 Flp pilus assembly complex ATPase component TadA [Providencia rettgeri]